MNRVKSSLSLTSKRGGRGYDSKSKFELFLIGTLVSLMFITIESGPNHNPSSFCVPVIGLGFFLKKRKD
uniref:Protein ROOT PRIMORDIUM DEFECTIVE 1 n=1 Tax=Rhizophora mucronata TaxID=61149 RepID=A0A2P2QMB2_RHIMU